MENKLDICISLYRKFREACENARQGELPNLFAKDFLMQIALSDLEANYTDAHANTFIAAISKLLDDLEETYDA